MNFKSLRVDKLKLSQEEFANIIGVEVSKIKEWEKTNEPSMAALQKISVSTGMDFNTIMNYEKPKPKAFDAKNTWGKVNFTKKSIVDYINESLKNLEVPEEQRHKYLDDLRVGIERNLVKPSVSIVGRSDTGKSTLINTLIGMEKMPTSWTPTTSIAIYIKHINDRPKFVKDDVWIFTDNVDGEDLWDANRLYDEEYCKKWKIAQGGVEVLSSFGTRQGDSFTKNAGSAVVFLDAPILQNCDIVDLPGFGTEKESDDTITFKAAQRTDVLIYLSQANGFMRIEDITYLKENVRNLPVWEKKGENDLQPLSNLFVVASQAHTISNGNQAELDNILKKGCENFCKTLSYEYWDKRKEVSGFKIENYNEQALAQRFYTYTIDIPNLCNEFNNDLRKILERLPEIIDARTKEFIHEYVKKNRSNLEKEIKHYEEIMLERDKYLNLLGHIESSELDRIKENDKRKDEIHRLINVLSLKAANDFSKYCSGVINTDSLTKMIKEKKINNKKEEVEYFASNLLDTIQAKCDAILADNAETLSKEVKVYLEKYNEGIKAAFDCAAVDVDFDVSYAFASALAKIGIIGGLGAYMASVAALVFGSFTFLTGIGGTIALGAAFIGPIGIAIGILITASIGICKLFGGGWEKSVAKKLVKAYDENKVVEQFREGITDYWKKTEAAFDQAAQELDEEWSNYVETLRNMVNNYDVEEIKENILVLKNVISFFENIPL